MPAQKEAQRNYGIVIAAAVLLLVTVLYAGFTFFHKENDQVSRYAHISTVGPGKSTSESKKYDHDLNAYNSKNADQARRGGQSYLSSLSTMSGNTVDQPETASGLGLPTPSPTPPVKQEPQQVKTAQASIKTNTPTEHQPQVNPYAYGTRWLSKSDTEAVVAMMEQWAGASSKGGIAAAAIDTEEDYANSIKRSQSPRATQLGTEKGGATGANAAIEALKQEVLVAPYSLTYAQLLTEVNTDEASLVRAQIPPGFPYAGAMLYADGYKRLQNDVDMTFNAMMYQGHAYKITAKPLDLNTSRTALSGSVSHHYFSRLILPAIATGIANTSQMFQTAGEQSVVTGQGSVVTSAASTPSTRNITGSFIGGVGQSGSQLLTQAASQIPVKTTVVPEGEMIGIQFIGGVTMADDMSLAKTGAAETAKATEQAAATPASAASSSATANTSTSAGQQTAIMPHLPSGFRYTPAGAVVSGTAQ